MKIKMEFTGHGASFPVKVKRSSTIHLVGRAVFPEEGSPREDNSPKTNKNTTLFHSNTDMALLERRGVSSNNNNNTKKSIKEKR